MSIRTVLLSQIAGYGIVLILSLCIIVPTSMHQSEFNGHCLLFSGGYWGPKEDNSCILSVSWASSGYCNYAVVVGIITNIVSCAQIYRLSVLVYKGLDSSFLSAFLEAVCCMALCGLTVAAAIIVSLGFMAWCQTMEERYPSCEDAVGQEIIENENISTGGFYIELGIAQVAVWAAFATWVGLAVLSMLKVCHYHRLANFSGERRRLLHDSRTPTA